jgi:hypothetical protein
MNFGRESKTETVHVFPIRFLLTDYAAINVIKGECYSITKQKIIIKPDINSIDRGSVTWINESCNSRAGPPLGV